MKKILLITVLSLLSLSVKAESKVLIWHPEYKVSQGCIYFAQAVDRIPARTYIEFNCILQQKDGDPTTWRYEYFDGRNWVSGRETATEYLGYEHNTVFADSYTLRKAVKDSLRVRMVADTPCNGRITIKEGSFEKTTITAYPGIKAKDVTKIGIIGNSFTYYGRTWTMLSEIARSQGHQLVSRVSVMGGQTFREQLGRHLTQELIAEGGYDVVIIQDQSMQHAYYTSKPEMRDGILSGNKDICAAIKATSPNARIILERTWAYPKNNNWMEYGSKNAMADAIIKGSEALRDACGYELSPITEAVSEAYDEQIPNLFSKDNKHNGSSISYLKACVDYLKVFGEPFDGNVPDCGIDPEIAAKLRAIALKTMGF